MQAPPVAAPPPPTAAPPPSGWTYPPPPRPSGLPTWAIVVIVVVVVVVVLAVLAAVLFVMVGGMLSGPGVSRPVVTLSTPEAHGTNGFQFTVAGASQSKPIANYRLNVLVGASTSTEGARTLSSSQTFTVGGQVYTATYTDIGGEGSLTPGDIFTVTKASGDLTPGTTYSVLILWSDGSTLAQVAYP